MLSVPPFGGRHGTGGQVIADADGTHRVVVTYDDVPGPWKYTAEGRLLNGTPMITELLVQQRDPSRPTAITQTLLRRVQIVLIFDRIKRALHANWSDRVSQLLGDARTQMPKAGRSWHAEHFIQVAWAYTEAEQHGRSPRKAIADKWNVSLVTASRWLSEARKRGYLAPYAPGRNSDTEGDLWSRQRFATSAVESSVVRAFLTRTVNDAMRASPETAVATILDTLFALGGDAISRNTGIEHGDNVLSIRAFTRELFALAEPDQSDAVRSAATALIDVLASDGQSEPPS
ncbi:hypothetical protein [Nocardia sp. NPDC058705]|uniref:hypothetical protein n=1 Tax=Nocardia sp. NPDC058705 TaxID=3346609 RepID=UPI0036BEFC32